jgi:hypothetical protein
MNYIRLPQCRGALTTAASHQRHRHSEKQQLNASILPHRADVCRRASFPSQISGGGTALFCNLGFENTKALKSPTLPTQLRGRSKRRLREEEGATLIAVSILHNYCINAIETATHYSLVGGRRNIRTRRSRRRKSRSHDQPEAHMKCSDSYFPYFTCSPSFSRQPTIILASWIHGQACCREV